MQIGLPEVTTAAALEEKQKLQKGIGYLDMIFFTSAALIGLDTLALFLQRITGTYVASLLGNHLSHALWTAYSRTGKHFY